VSDLDGDSDMHAAGSQRVSTTCTRAVKALLRRRQGRHRCCRRGEKNEHRQAHASHSDTQVQRDREVQQRNQAG